MQKKRECERFSFTFSVEAKKNPGSRSHPGDDQNTKTIIKSAASSSAAEKSFIGNHHKGNSSKGL